MSSTKKSPPAEDFQLSITVAKTPHEVFEAINNVKDWWVGSFEGKSHKLNDEFIYAYKDFHKSTQKITEMVKDKKVAWLVTDSSLKFLKDKQEWKGTQIEFEIVPKGDKTEIKFTHRGLTPDIECFEACSGGWEFYILKSLKSYLVTGKGLDPGF